MRVFYDGYIYRVQRNGGVNRYFANLIGRLPKDVQPTLISDCRREHNFPQNARLRLFQGRQRRTNYLTRRLLALYFRAVAGCVRFDVAHPTYYSLLTRRPISAYRCPVAMTVYDMIDELFPDEVDPTGVAAQLKRQAVAHAQAVICISENTRQDLLERYPVPDEKVHVIPLAADLDQTCSHGPEPVPDRPYFLFVGQRSGYKNFTGLVTAFGRVAAQCPELALCIVGPTLSPTERQFLAQNGITQHVEFYGHVSDTHLAKLYRCCLAFIYPSLYEGFGLPVLEAMACGAAVIACNRASIPEVAGDAALLFEPDKDDELTDALRLIWDNASERERLAARGLQRAKMFSWAETVARTVDVYRALSQYKL